MPIIACLTGAVLIAIGLICRALSDSPSITILIPAFLGLAIAVCGGLALRAAWRRHAMHAAAAVAVLGILGSAGALAQLPALLTGGEVARPLAVGARSATCVCCAVFTGLAVASFIRARRARA